MLELEIIFVIIGLFEIWWFFRLRFIKKKLDKNAQNLGIFIQEIEKLKNLWANLRKL